MKILFVTFIRHTKISAKFIIPAHLRFDHVTLHKFPKKEILFPNKNRKLSYTWLHKFPKKENFVPITLDTPCTNRNRGIWERDLGKGFGIWDGMGLGFGIGRGKG